MVSRIEQVCLPAMLVVLGVMTPLGVAAGLADDAEAVPADWPRDAPRARL